MLEMAWELQIHYAGTWGDTLLIRMNIIFVIVL